MRIIFKQQKIKAKEVEAEGMLTISFYQITFLIGRVVAITMLISKPDNDITKTTGQYLS